MSDKIEHVFDDIPVVENSKQIFENLSSSKEEHIILAHNLLNFYLSQDNENSQLASISYNFDTNLKDDYLNAIHLLLVAFTYIVISKDEDAFGQFVRRFIYESKNDSKEVFLLKRFFITNFDSTEEYHIGTITSHQNIKKRTDILLLKYIQFFHYY